MSQNRAEEHRQAQAKDALRGEPKPEADRSREEQIKPQTNVTAEARHIPLPRTDTRQKVTSQSNVVKANEPEMSQTLDRKVAMEVPDDMSKRVPQFNDGDRHAEKPEDGALRRQRAHDARLPPSQRQAGIVEEIPADKRMFVSDELAAILSDKYAHHDIKYTKDGIEVHAGGECISIDAGKVGKCKNNAELRAYIASIPVL